ncbi:MAG: ABC transporter ATP-binding protein [Bifidobacteriaceae bacterium]|nr:ABC transporter ATP-binding protein [Bifidobacteriaceae bacterium]
MRFDGVSVSKGALRILTDIAFSVSRGTVHALLGHNGAGKTTLIRALLGLVPLRSGSIHIATGRPVQAVFSGERFPGDLSVRAIVDHQMTLHGGASHGAAIERLGVGRFIDKRAGQLSTGMAQRLGIALALIAGGDVLVLDEPTAGLDPQGVGLLREVVTDLSSRGKAILMCSHDLAELELVCEEVTCLADGRLTISGAVREIGKELPAVEHFLRTTDDGAAVKRLSGAVSGVFLAPRGVRVPSGMDLSGTSWLLGPEIRILEATPARGLFHRIYERYGVAAGDRSAA